ncbi:hypothetical protein SDJN03_20231, partial [Cucurbita argyrosperma subsp. sororia]
MTTALAALQLAFLSPAASKKLAYPDSSLLYRVSLLFSKEGSCWCCFKVSGFQKHDDFARPNELTKDSDYSHRYRRRVTSAEFELLDA